MPKMTGRSNNKGSLSIAVTAAVVMLCEIAAGAPGMACAMSAGTTETARSEASALVASAGGGVIAVWRSVRGGSAEVRAQKFDNKGRELWQQNGVVVCRAEASNAHFSAVSDTKGGIIIFWEDIREGKYASDIYSQRLDADGDPLWAKGGVPVCTARHQQLYPKGVEDQHGGAFVFWTDYRNANADVYGAHIDARGNVDHSWAISTGKEDQMDIAAAASPSGGACVVWIDHRYDNPGIYAQVVSAGDSLIWRKNGLPVCTGLYQPEHASVDAIEDGRYLFSWDDYRDRIARVFLQLVEPNGDEVSPSNGLSVASSSGPQYGPSVCVTGAASAAVTWLQYGGGALMMQQHAALSGRIELEHAEELTNPSLTQLWVHSAADGSGGAVAVWVKYAGNNIVIRAQRTGPDGRLMWGKDGVSVGTAGGETHPCVVRSNDSETFFVSWTARSTTGSRVMVAALSGNGARIWEGQL